MSTDFEKAYQTILDAAKMYNVKKEDMPTMLLVLSDMQFNESLRHNYEEPDKPHFELLKEQFEDAGYSVPKIVFWNLRSSTCEGSPAQATDTDVAMVSGFSPVLMKAILAVKNFNPIDVMMKALEGINIDVTHLPEKINFSDKSPEWDGEEYEPDYAYFASFVGT
jgi:hypothetical protein